MMKLWENGLGEIMQLKEVDSFFYHAIQEVYLESMVTDLRMSMDVHREENGDAPGLCGTPKNGVAISHRTRFTFRLEKAFLNGLGTVHKRCHALGVGWWFLKT